MSSGVSGLRQVLDGTQALLARLDYTPYGEPDAWAGALPSMTYTGHYWDPETGMYFAPFRYLMPGAGRWLTRDPLGVSAGLNLYAYPFNPLLYADPLGLKWCPPGWFGPVLVTVGATVGSIAGVAVKSATGLALGMGPGAWIALGVGVAALGIITTVMNPKEQAESIIDDTGIVPILNQRNQDIDDVLDHLDKEPEKDKKDSPAKDSDDLC